MRQANHPQTCAVLSLVLLAATQHAAADFKKLLGLVPGEANALVIIDVKQLMDSPLATREGWKEKHAQSYAEKPLLVPPAAERMVLAALIDPARMTSVWEVSVMDLAETLSLKDIARVEGGHLDPLGGKQAAWAPIDAYFIELDERVLGAVAPANRQFAARWASKKSTLGGAFVSRYLRRAVNAVDAQTPIVMAMDLADITSVPRLKRGLESNPFESLQGSEVAVDDLCELLASIKGVTLHIEVGEQAVGQAVIEFDRDAGVLSDVAKPLLLEVLSDVGANIDDLKLWEVSVDRKQVVAKGELSSEGLRRVLSVVDPPVPFDAAADPEATAGGANAKASLEYFEAIVSMVDNLQDRTGAQSASLSDAAVWTGRDARRISRLPTAGVDADLIAWGAASANNLRQVAQILEVHGLKMRSRTSSMHIGRGNVGQAKAARARRRQAAMDEKRAASEATFELLQELQASTAEIRRTMSERYGTEF